jgi:UDP-N-acetylglucosamine 2-epimerase (non-hydrolysing)
VDDPANFRTILEALAEIADELPLVFPVHPRTRKRLLEFGLGEFVREPQAGEKTGGITLTEPLGYLDFMKLTKESCLVLTDSGGIQEETTVLGVPCLTLRENTERPVTLTSGTNLLVGMDRELIVREAKKRIHGSVQSHTIPPYWDGKAAERIVEKIVELLKRNVA